MILPKRKRLGMIVWYIHHGRKVAVDVLLKGLHRDFCLCYKCDLFHPEHRPGNCWIANDTYDNCVKNDIVTPVWECPEFQKKVA